LLSGQQIAESVRERLVFQVSIDFVAVVHSIDVAELW